MRIIVKVNDLTEEQFTEVNRVVKVEYEIPPGVVRVDATFELNPSIERTVEMPLSIFTIVTRHLAHLGEGKLPPTALLASATLTPDALL